jgi:rSAM/selenodomain-associated transferase 1
MPAADDRVLAVMMKAPRPGRVKTRLAAAHSPDRVVTLYRALVEDTIELSRQLRVRTVGICPDGDETDIADWLGCEVEILPQQGAGLAAGLRSTFEQLCSDTHRRVIAFNADSPHLPAQAIESAFDALPSADLVVGPCDDGGYYLVGATRSHDGLFDAAAMGRESACRALVAEAARQGLRVALTAEHYDVDLPADLIRLANDLARDATRAPRTADVLASWGLLAPSRS